MIVSFSVAPEVFDSFQADDPLAHHAHVRLHEAWRLLGCLSLPVDDRERHAWFQALQRLPTPMRKRWQTGLMHNRWTLKGDAALHCVTPEQAAAAGVVAPQVSIVADREREVCRYDFADRALSFVQAREESHRGILPGVEVQHTWERKFQGLMEQARHVVLVDRYALEGHLAKGRTPPSGLERLMHELDALPRPVTMTLYTQPRANHARAVSQLAASLTQGGLREWRVRLVGDEAFIRHAHDRHLRIDRSVVQLGKGIEVLAGSHVFAASDFDLKPFSPFARAREEELRRACKETRWARRGATHELTRTEI